MHVAQVMKLRGDHSVRHCPSISAVKRRAIMGYSKTTFRWALVSIFVVASSIAAAQSGGGGNGNGGAGGGNAHGAATARPTNGGDNVSTPGSTKPGGFQFKHKRKVKPETPQ
jgi:hypothetical protein